MINSKPIGQEPTHDPIFITSGTFVKPDKPYNNLYIGAAPINFENNILWYKWNGGIRNIIMFNKHLTNIEIKRLFEKGITNRYLWNYSDEYLDIKKLKETQLLSVVNLNNVNVMDINYCNIQQETLELPSEFWASSEM